MDISIIIPVYNEHKKIQGDILTAAGFLHREGLKGEIIVVDDGSADGTSEAAEHVKVPAGIEKRVIHYTPNRGKGYAVRTGMLSAKGKNVMFADSGCCVPYDFILRGIALISSGKCDIAHGSRKRHDSIIKRRRRLARRITSKLFRWFVIIFLGVPRHFTDTQCGFKVYKGDVAKELFSESCVDGFMFDIEILLRAQRKGYKILEFPVQWSSDYDTRVLPLKTSRGVFSEFFKIKRALAKQE